MTSKRETFEKCTKLSAWWLNWVAVAALAIMLCVTIVDILGCKLFRWPVPGSVDITGLLMLLTAAFGIAWTEVLRRHIRVDFLVLRLSERLKRIFNMVSSSLSIIIFVLIIWACAQYGVGLFASGEGTLTLEIPLYPFVFIIAFTCIPLLLVLLWELFESMKKVREK